MIDGLKIGINMGNTEELLANNLLEFTTPVVEKTGELRDHIKTSNYNHLKIEVIKRANEDYIAINGSIHKYLHGYNHSDYTFNDLTDSISDLCNKLNINPHLARLHNLEYGVNIELPQSPETVLNAIINHKGEGFSPMQTRRGKSIGIECKKQRFIIKIYDKGKQYGLDKNLLRIEVKVIKMTHLANEGINTLADLLNYDKLARLGNLLTTMFNDLMIYDSSIDTTKRNARDQLLLIEGYNPKYWQDLKKCNPKKYCKTRSRFRSLIDRYSRDHLQRNIATKINEKWTELLNTNDQTRDKLTAFLDRFTVPDTGGIN